MGNNEPRSKPTNFLEIHAGNHPDKTAIIGMQDGSAESRDPAFIEAAKPGGHGIELIWDIIAPFPVEAAIGSEIEGTEFTDHHRVVFIQPLDIGEQHILLLRDLGPGFATIATGNQGTKTGRYP